MNNFLGLDQNDLGQFIQEVLKREFTDKGKQLPEFIANGATGKRFDIFDTRYLGDKVVELLGSENKIAFAANHEFKTGNNEMIIVVGARLDESAGAAADLMHTLDFDTVSDTKLKNALFSFKANGIKEMDEQEVNHLFANEFDTTNYHRFNSPVLVKPNQLVEATIKSEVAPALWARLHLIGLKITTKTAE